MVIGSRKVDDARVEVPQATYRRVGSKAFALVRNALVGLGDIRDTQCGFKFFKRSAAKAIFSRQRVDGYMFDVEILYLARKRRLRLAEVPIVWYFQASSRVSPLRDTIRMFRDILRVRWNDARGRYA